MDGDMDQLDTAQNRDTERASGKTGARISRCEVTDSGGQEESFRVWGGGPCYLGGGTLSVGKGVNEEGNRRNRPSYFQYSTLCLACS